MSSKTKNINRCTCDAFPEKKDNNKEIHDMNVFIRQSEEEEGKPVNSKIKNGAQD